MKKFLTISEIPSSICNTRKKMNDIVDLFVFLSIKFKKNEEIFIFHILNVVNAVFCTSW